MRFYLSDIHGAWPFSRQEAALDAAYPDWRKGSVYRDTLKRGQRKSRSIVALVERESLLRKFSRARPDEVVIAGWPPLAWSVSDLIPVLGAMSDKGYTLTDLDTKIVLTPDASPSEVAAACKAFELACRRKGEFGKTGGQVSGERRAAAARAGCDRIKERWKLPSRDHPTQDLLAEAGVSLPTAIAYLGRRIVAQRKQVLSEATAERNRKRKQRRDDSERE